MNRTLAFLAAILLTTLSVTTTCLAGPTNAITFSMAPDSRADRVQLTMRSRWNDDNSNWSSDFPLTELRGLDSAQLRGGGPVNFAIVREPGRIDCAGTGGRQSAGGTCRFTPDTGFNGFLASRGVGRPSFSQSFTLTMANVGRAHVDALAANHYPVPTVEQLTALGIHGASPQFIRELASAGYRLKSVGDLVTFRIHGVTPDYIRAMTAAGPRFRTLSAEDLVTFRIHGVSPALVGTFARLGYNGIGPSDIVAMTIHGVTPRYVEQLAQLGYRNLSANDLVQMRIMGVTPEFVRSVQRNGMNRPSADQLVRLRLSGYQPGSR